MRSFYTTGASFWDFTLPMLVQGVSMSTFFVSMLTIQLDGIPPERLPSATGIANFARIVSGSFAASITTTAWDQREALHQSRLSDTITPGSSAWETVRHTLTSLGATDTQAAAAVTRQMAGQAYLLASIDLFRLSAWLCFAMVLLVWFTKRPKAPGGPVAAD